MWDSAIEKRMWCSERKQYYCFFFFFFLLVYLIAYLFVYSLQCEIIFSFLVIKVIYNILLYNILYHIVGNFRGEIFTWFSIIKFIHGKKIHWFTAQCHLN